MQNECRCGKTLGPRNTCGMCRSCLAKRNNADPAVQQRCRDGQKAFFARPGNREAYAARLRHHLTHMSDKERQRRSENGKRRYRENLSDPEVQARALKSRMRPDVLARQGRSVTRTRLGWCPEELLPLYRDLTKSGLRASEAREAMQSMIPGTPEHAKRIVANFRDAMRIKRERDIASRY